MKIVYLVGGFPKLSETFILNQITGLIDRGHEIEIVAYQDPKEAKVHEDVVRYGLLEKTHYIQYNNELSLLNTKNVRQLVPCLDADLVHVHFAARPADVALDILRKIGIPYIITAHAYDIFISPDVEGLRAKFSAAEKVITVSQFNRKYLLDLLGQEFAEKIEVQYLGIDLDKFRFIKREPKDKVTILFIGRLIEKKGVPDAIETFRYVVEKHPAVELRIIGDGPQKEEALRKVEEFKITDNVKFPGSLTQEDVTEEMERADIFFLPSATAPDGDREGLPVVVLEAEAAGLPVVSTLHTGIPEAVVDGETGFLLQEHDTKGMASRLCELIENQDMRIRMGVTGRKAVEIRHNLDKEIDRLERLIKNIVKSVEQQSERQDRTSVEYEKRVSRYYAEVMEHMENSFAHQIRQQETGFVQKLKQQEGQIRQQEQQIRQQEGQIRQQEGQIRQQEQQTRRLQRMVSEHDGFIKGIQKTPPYRIYDKIKPLIKRILGKVTATVEKEKVKLKTPKNPLPFSLPPIEGVGNDYTFLERKLHQALQNGITYCKGVSVVIPVYNRKVILEKTLAAMTHQTYPGYLIEIIIADDGSSDGVEEVIEKFKKDFDIKHVKQEDKGYRLSEIRNKGIKKARYDYIILLDCDMLPVPELIEEYMKWFHVVDNVVLLGHRRFVNTDMVSASHIRKDVSIALKLSDVSPVNDSLNPTATSDPIRDWRMTIYEKSDYLKSEPLYFRVLCGGNVGICKKYIEQAGYFDESFVKWGCEDQEFGFRLYQMGLYFIPLLTATGMHQEHPFNGSRKKDQEENMKILEQKVATNVYRTYKRGVLYETPKVSIYIPAYNIEKFIKQTVDSALNQTYTDLEICICDDGSTDGTLKVIEENYSGNPMVRWVSIPHGGIGKASNTAVKMCRGTYIGQLDSDDILKPDAVETLVDYLDKHPEVGCVYATYEKIDENGKFIGEGYDWPVFSREKLLNNMIVHHFRMFRKRDWNRTEGFNEVFKNAVDYDMYVKLSEVCNCYHISKVLYKRRLHGLNTSIVAEKVQTDNTYEVVNGILRKYGLDRTWELHLPDPSNPRNVNFKKRDIVDKTKLVAE